VVLFGIVVPSLGNNIVGQKCTKYIYIYIYVRLYVDIHAKLLVDIW
jgi:hypothetical protein